ncbi:MAG TPA: hypothetical protein VKR27_03385, partial [Acidimicrobiales bacterium]|nr:hypothetical protein [Acidimicrobiales bacterium]
MNRLARAFIIVSLGAGSIVLASVPTSASVDHMGNVLSSIRELQQAESATLAARSVKLVEFFVIGKRPVSARVQGRWPDRVHISVATGGLAEQIFIARRSVYVIANAKAWEVAYRLPRPAARELAGRWFVTSRSDRKLGSVALSTFNPKALERPLFAELNTASGELTLARVRESGRPALELSGASVAVFISAIGRPYIRRIVSVLPTDHGHLDLSAFDRATRFAFPKAA